MSAIEPLVWTSKEFKKKSSSFNPAKRGRGTVIQAIDRALEDFDDNRYSMNINDKLRTAQFVCQCCRLWLAGKTGKTSKNSKMRRDAVTTLANQAWEYIQFHTFSKQKIGGVQAQGQALRPGYASERTHYLATQKAAHPISGSYMHEVTEDPAALAHLAGKSFAQLTHLDYLALDRVFQGNVGDGSGIVFQVKRNVYFMKKQERMKHLLIIDNGEFWEAFDKKYTTGGARAYVMDEYGNLYSTEAIIGKGTGSNFNHSTFNAGKDVICAGLIEVQAGRLQYIDNKSGHYKPSRQNLHNLITILNRLGVNLFGAKVVVSELDLTRPGTGKLIDNEYDNAHIFLANMLAPPSRSIAEP